MNLFAKERLIRRELSTIKPMRYVDSSSYPYDVQRAIDYIHDHAFDECLNVNRVLVACDLRSHNISGRFTRFVGMGLRHYIENRRLMAAMRLLSFEVLEVYLIAAAVGYAHHESFTRAFRRAVGFSPSSYREHVVRKRPTRGAPLTNALRRRCQGKLSEKRRADTVR